LWANQFSFEIDGQFQPIDNTTMHIQLSQQQWELFKLNGAEFRVAGKAVLLFAVPGDDILNTDW